MSYSFFASWIQEQHSFFPSDSLRFMGLQSRCSSGLEPSAGLTRPGGPASKMAPSQGGCRKVSVPCHRDFSLGYSSILMTWQPAYPSTCVLRVYRSHFVLFYERRLEAILHTICNILLVMQDISTHCVREHTSAQIPRSKNPLGAILETAHHRGLKWAKILPF